MKFEILSILSFGCLVAQSDAFGLPELKTSPRQTSLQMSSNAVLEDESTPTDISLMSRRQAFLSGISIVGATVAGTYFASDLTTTTTGREESVLFAPVSSLDEAIALIESSCDKRFLHAVVASDYKLLYQPNHQHVKSIGIQETVRGGDEISWQANEGLDADVLAYLQSHQFQDRPLQPSSEHCQLALSNFEMVQSKYQVRKSNDIVSVWPLSEAGQDIHYAWAEKGGTIQKDSSVIVDGVDCGRMSLEDALEYEDGSKQVLIQADKFLLIPQSLEAQLVSKLRGAFLI